MKKVIALLRKLAAVFLLFQCLVFAPMVLAANTATELYTEDTRVYGYGPVHYVNVAIDTTDTDLTVYDPAADRSACLVGLVFADSTATNLTIKSQADTLVVLELAANQGVFQTNGAILCTEDGQDLEVSSSAALTSALFMIVEAKALFRK